MYSAHFRHADDIVEHLNGVVPGLSDPLLAAKYVGFVAVASITVYEVAIKEMFLGFARRKHKVLGVFVESYFDRINGRIGIEKLRLDYLPRFGSEYRPRFEKQLHTVSEAYIKDCGRDIKTAYSNLIAWRNNFSHTGQTNTTATYSEVVQAYEDGKHVISCLSKSLVS